jgi:hypothetical protein
LKPMKSKSLFLLLQCGQTDLALLQHTNRAYFMFVACEKVNYLDLKTVHLSANMVKGIVMYCDSATTKLNFFDTLSDSFISVQDSSTFK